jgi:hypothetical protein
MWLFKELQSAFWNKHGSRSTPLKYCIQKLVTKLEPMVSLRDQSVGGWKVFNETVKGIGKGKSCPCALTEHNAMKAYWRSGGIAPCILDLSTRQRCTGC